MYPINWSKPPVKIDILELEKRSRINRCGQVLSNASQYGISEEEQDHIYSQLNSPQNRQLIYVRPDSEIGEKLVMSGKDKLFIGNEEYRLTDSIKDESDVDKLVSSVKNKEKDEIKELKKFLTPICSLAVDVNKLSRAYFKIIGEDFKIDEKFFVEDNEDQKTAIRIITSYQGYEYNIKFCIVVRTTRNFLWLWKKEIEEVEKVLELNFLEDKVETIFFNGNEKSNLNTWLPRLSPLVEVLSNKIIHYFELIKQHKEKVSYQDAYKYEIPNKVEDYRKAIKEITEN